MSTLNNNEENVPFELILDLKNLYELEVIASRRLFRAINKDETIELILNDIKEYLHADYSFLYLNDLDPESLFDDESNFIFKPKILGDFPNYDQEKKFGELKITLEDIQDLTALVQKNDNQLSHLIIDETNHYNEALYNALIEVGSRSTIVLILRNNDELFGFIGISFKKEHRIFSKAEIQVLENIAVAIASKISDERKMIKLEESKQKAIAQTNAKSNFVANMSHEIRNPLNAIMGIVSILTEDDLTLETQKYVRILRSSGQALLKIVNNVLDISKIEAGKLELEKNVFSLRNVIKEVTYLFRESFKDKNVLIRYHIDEEIPEMLVGYSDAIQQVITNLTGNSLKFTNEGSVNVNCKLLKKNDKKIRILIEIVDTGIGMDEEQVSRIFGSYTQANSRINGVYGGTGLGLSISKGLVEYMGSEICVESKLGEGSRMFFELNLDIASNEVIKEIIDIETDKQNYINNLKINVLVVDDSVDNRQLIQMYLKKYQCNLVLAENGVDAITKFKKGEFDIVFMDIQMPIMDGQTATREIREYEKAFNLAPTPIIALTSYVFKEKIEKFMSNGFSAHLTKPLAKKTLIQVLDSYKNRISRERK